MLGGDIGLTSVYNDLIILIKSRVHQCLCNKVVNLYGHREGPLCTVINQYVPIRVVSRTSNIQSIKLKLKCRPHSKTLQIFNQYTPIWYIKRR